MSPYVIFGLGLIASFLAGLWTSHADPFTAATLSAFGAIGLSGLAIIFKSPDHVLTRLHTTYVVNAAIVCLAVGIAQARISNAPKTPGPVSVYFSGTCETLIPLRDGRDARLFFDGESFAFIRHEDITAMLPTPGCRERLPTNKDASRHG